MSIITEFRTGDIRFADPVVMERGRYRAPLVAGASTEMLEQSRELHRFTI